MRWKTYSYKVYKIRNPRELDIWEGERTYTLQNQMKVFKYNPTKHTKVIYKLKMAK